MNRRGFLGALAAALVAPDPEQLLWRPGARLISIPRPRTVRWITGVNPGGPSLAFHRDAYLLAFSMPTRLKLSTKLDPERW